MSVAHAILPNTQRNIATFARTKLDEHGLKDWRFAFNTNKSRLGVCRYPEKRIEISYYHLPDGEDKIKNTVLHEIAHALAGPRAKHSYEWVRVARSIGCDGQRCGERMEHAPHRYEATCIGCGKVHKAFKRRRRPTSCRCFGYFNPNAILDFNEVD